jgi:hypothetical protein
MVDFSGWAGTTPKTARWAATRPGTTDGLPWRVEVELRRLAAVGGLPQRMEAEASAGGAWRRSSSPHCAPQAQTIAPQASVSAAF